MTADDIQQAETIDQLTIMGRRIADRMAAEKSFPWPAETLVRVASDIRERALGALPNHAPSSIDAISEATFSAFADRSLELSQLLRRSSNDDN